MRFAKLPLFWDKKKFLEHDKRPFTYALHHFVGLKTFIVWLVTETYLYPEQQCVDFEYLNSREDQYTRSKIASIELITCSVCLNISLKCKF